MTAVIPDPNDSSVVTRRGILVGAAASLICAPAIVQVTSLMPVRPLPFPFGRQFAGFVERLYLHALENSFKACLLDGRTSFELGGHTISVDIARQRVSYARAHGFLPPYVCIYRDE